jgi:WD40 repeat protein
MRSFVGAASLALALAGCATAPAQLHRPDRVTFSSESELTDACFGPKDGSIVATRGRTLEAVKDGASRRFDEPPGDPAFGLVWGPITVSGDGKLAAAHCYTTSAGDATSTSLFRLWTVEDGKLAGTLEADGPPHDIHTPVLSTNGDWLAWTAFDSAVRLYDLKAARAAGPLSRQDRFERLLEQTDAPSTAAYPGNGAPREALERWTADRTAHGFRCAAFSPAGDLIAAGAEDGFVYVWSLPDGKLRHKIETAHETKSFRGLLGVAFSADGQLLAAGGFEAFVEVFSMKDGSRLAKSGPYGRVFSLAFSPRGDALAVREGEGNVFIFEVPDLTLRYVHEDKTLSSELSFSPTGELLLVPAGKHDAAVFGVPRLAH